MPRRDSCGDLACAVHGRQVSTGKCATKTLKKPPWNAIHSRQYHRVRPYQWAYLARHLPQARRFDRNDYQVLHAHGSSITAGGNRVRRIT